MGVHQECNTFSPILTTLEDFHIRRGQDMVEHWRGTRTEIGGFIHVLNRPGVETVPLFVGWAITKGRIVESEFAGMKEIWRNRCAPHCRWTDCWWRCTAPCARRVPMTRRARCWK